MTYSFENFVASKRELTKRYLLSKDYQYHVRPSHRFRLMMAAAAPTSNVHALGVGYRITNGLQTGELAVRIYVHRKLPLSVLSDDQKLPTAINGLPIERHRILAGAFRHRSLSTARPTGPARDQHRTFRGHGRNNRLHLPIIRPR